MKRITNFIREHKSLTGILFFVVTVTMLSFISVWGWLSVLEKTAENDTSPAWTRELSTIGSIIIEVFAVLLGLCLAFSYDAWIKRLDLNEEKKTILLGIKEEFKTIVNRINEDASLEEVLSQRSYYESLSASGAIQKVMNTTHFQTISYIYRKIEYFYDYLRDKTKNENATKQYLQLRFSELYEKDDLNDFNYTEWLRLLCQIVYVSEHPVEDWAEIKTDEGVYMLIREFEINSFKFVDEATITERQNILATVFPRNTRLWLISNLRKRKDIDPKKFLDVKRSEYFYSVNLGSGISYEHIVSNVLNKLSSGKKSRSLSRKKRYRAFFDSGSFIYEFIEEGICYAIAVRLKEGRICYIITTESEISHFIKEELGNI